MVINKSENMKEYVEYLQTHPSEKQALFDDMLIGVTSFFREPDTFLALKEKVFPELVKNSLPANRYELGFLAVQQAKKSTP